MTAFNTLLTFQINCDEANDETIYEISINKTLFATVTYDKIEFHNVAVFNSTMSEQMKILDAAWKEFERRDSWSDFECELRVDL